MAGNRIEERFESNAAAGRGALLPYFTSGFPDLGITAELIRRADNLGATAVEIGVPYSDSIADGPVIQESFNYALRRGHKVEEMFQLVSELRPSVECALIAMVSYSVVHRQGVSGFMERAAAAGFDGVILPDVPVEESAPIYAAARRAGLCHIGLVAPTTSPVRRVAIARASSGFIYQIAVAGTTGERRGLPEGLRDAVGRLREIGGLPVCVGFGISSAEQVRAVCACADGAIVGSAVVRRIADAIKGGVDADTLVASVSAFLSQLIQQAGLPPASWPARKV
jgi:tryptophan synthase alpha chain